MMDIKLVISGETLSDLSSHSRIKFVSSESLYVAIIYVNFMKVARINGGWKHGTLFCNLLVCVRNHKLC